VRLALDSVTEGGETGRRWRAEGCGKGRGYADDKIVGGTKGARGGRHDRRRYQKCIPTTRSSAVPKCIPTTRSSAAGGKEIQVNGIGSEVTAKVMERAAGLVESSQVRSLNVAADTAERALGVKYPVVNVYCEKITNGLREKFRSFSGTVQMAIEVRHSQDRLEGLQDRLETLVDAAMAMLTTARGDWGDGMFFGGTYEVTFGGVKQGGRNFIQVAKVTFDIGVSKD
jgi:hypothetical protein